MAVKYYLSRADEKRSIFLTYFASQLSSHASALGIDALTVTLVTNYAIFIAFLLNVNLALKKQKQEWVAYKNYFMNGKLGTLIPSMPTLPTITPPAVVITDPIFARVALLVNTIKNHPSYTESIGHDLGIIGSEILLPDINSVKPRVTAVADNIEVVLRWKKSEFTSVDIYRDRGTGNGYEFFANSSRSIFRKPLDLLPGNSSETWTFIAIYKIGDRALGLYSDPVTILVRIVV